MRPLSQFPKAFCAIEVRTAFFLLSCLGASNIQAQVCAISGPEVPNSNGQLRCLDIEELTGDTVLLPTNVTRLEPDGISLCPLRSASTAPPAVIFIVDHSGSMNPSFSTPGDPFSYRAVMVRNAIRYLKEKANVGWFGYIEFSADIDIPFSDNSYCPDGVNGNATHLISQPLIPLSDANVGLWSSRVGPIQNRCNGGTNYLAPLERAKEYMRSFSTGDGEPNFSVVFISDGLPNRPDDRYSTAAAVLEEDFRVPGPFAPIHGIFLGTPGSDGDILPRLSEATGGSYNLVSPSDTSAMSRVMNGIIETITRRSEPESVTLRVGDATYNSVRLEEEEIGGGYRVYFPQTIPLGTGNNAIELSSVFTDTAGVRRTHSTAFTLDVSGDPAQEGQFPTDSYFEVLCAEERGITVGNLDNPRLIPGATLAETPHIDPVGMTTLDLALFARSLAESGAVLTILTARSGDRLEAHIPATGEEGRFAGNIPIVVLERTLEGEPRTARTTDSILQVASHDTLFLSWTHPEDPRDTLTATVLIYPNTLAQFSADTLYIDHIASQVRDAAAPGNTVSVRYFWSDGTPVSQAELVRVGSGDTYTGIADLRARLAEERTPTLVLQYTDALYGTVHNDTAVLIFELPVMPRVRLSDSNGDGQADRLEFIFASAIPPQQEVEDYVLIWGEQDQDTVRLRLPREDLPFLDYVTVVPSGDGQRWIIDLPAPLPFGHTTGSGPQGQGQLLVTGSFNDRNLDRTLPVIDAVGPVLLEMWVDPKLGLVNYMRVSEPLAEPAGQNWFLVRAGNAPDSERLVAQMEYNDATGIYTLTMVDDPDNLIMGGDSARFIAEALGGIRDRAGTGAHPDNPPIVVQGYREPRNAIALRYRESLLKPIPDPYIFPQDSSSGPEVYRVLEGTPADGMLRDVATGAVINDRQLRGMPLLEVSVTVPLLNGLDENGEVRQGPLVNDQLAWSTEVQVVTHTYDQLGQFIVRKTARYTVDDPDQVGPEGKAAFYLLWTPDPEKGIVDQFGRSVGTGPLMIRMEVTLISTALIDVDIYEADGSRSDRSVATGNSIRESKVSLSTLGYLRPAN